MANNIIKGRKGGSSSQRTPTEQPDDLQSVAKAKILIALGEGEFAGGLTGKDIYLDGTPLENADGSQNFSGVAWEFRPGTQAQSYIQGIPGTENEISVGTEVSSQTAWTHTFTNTQLSAVRVRLKWPSLMKQEDDGDVVGNTVKYAIDLQTDGGAWQTVLETAVSGKTTSGYERSHRIDLPQAGSTWTLRLRKVSPDANSVKIGDVMTLQSYTEVIDAKLRYPHTALLYIEFDSSQFNGSIPQISCEPRGRVIRVPDNYNPETREYTGTWTGGFKWAWTDNPAWIYYDIVVSDRFGLGDRLTSANISKWALYPIAQYCDQLVPDGRGGDGMEPRYICNVYVQERNDAYTVLRDFAAIFRGMTCWSGEQIIVQADMPRDVDFNYTRANILGSPRYSSSTSKARYTNALVSWSDPDNAYADAMEPAFIPELVSRYSFNQLEVTAIGCTRQSEAHRKGLWGILTNNKDRMVEIDVGLDGRIPQPGYIIGLGDERLAGRVNGGRISAVNGRVITLDRDIDAKEGDRLHLNLPSGISQARTIQSVNGRRQVTVTTAYSETPEAECVWIVEYTDLVPQQYRVIGVKDNNNGTLTITGVAHDPDKFPRIDIGAIIDQRPVSVLPAGNQSPPDDIVITSRSVVNQGISVETMQVNWSAVSGAIAYEAQWRRNDGNWINVPRSSTTSFEVSGIYAGRYLVRVRAINAAEISSGWAYSEEKTLTGKVGEPLAPMALATRSLVHGVQVSWEFPTGSGDTLRTELQYSKNQDGSAPMPLSDVAYPGKSYQQMGLSMGAEFWYRARLVDRLGNESPWTGWVQGMASDNFDDYYENLTDAIKDTAAWEETQRTISETQEGIRNTQQELEQTAEALRKEAEDQAKQVSQDIDASAKSITADVDGKISAVNKTITDEITSVNEALDSGLAQANKGVQEAKSAVADANKQIATVNKSLTDSITQVRQSVTDTAAEINATIDLEIARVSKTLADGDAALNAQIKTAENGLKQSLSQVNTTLTNAVKQETADRIADVNAKASQAADELLAATQGIEASIESLTQVMKTADENLAREMSSLAAGANIQFDSQVIWYFNNQTTEGWTGSAGVPGVSQDGWLRPADSATDPYITSPGGLAVDGAAYRFIMLRFRKTGKPVWAGEIRWVSAGENFTNTKRYIVAEPEYADGVATLTVRDIPWTGNIDRIRLDLTNQQDASNFIEFDWIAVGRPAPGASTAALQDVRSTLSNALTAEAQARSTLAAQMRGSYDGNDLEKVTSGLLYQEKTARVTAISAEVKARESLQTQFNDNKAAVSGELSSLTTEQSAQASRIGGLETSLGKKADAAALTSLTQKVEQQGATLTSQGAALTSLTNRVGQTETGLAGTNEALSGLQSVVTQQGDRITSQGQSITKLTSDLGTTNSALAKKADASAVSSLTNRVTQTEKDIRSQADSLTSLNTSLKQQATRGANVLPDGSFESYAVGDVLSNARAVITSEAAHSGTKSLRVTRSTEYNPNATDNNDTHIFSGMQVRDNAVYYVEAWVKLPAGSTADPTVYMVLGFSFQDSANGWSWPGLNVKVSELSVDNWTKVSGYLTNNRTALKQAMVRISIPNTPKVRLGDAFLIDDLIITDVTDAKAALDAADANAQALSSLSASVTQNGKNITSQGSAITKLQSDVTQLGKDISGKADASALTNLTTRVTATEGSLKSQGDSLTSLQNSLNTTNSNVAKKADATALQSLQNTVEQHGRDLTAQSSALTNLENNFSSLAVGGTNLIRNADTLEGWSSRHATETYLGDRVAYTRLAKGASGYIQLDEQTLDVTGRTEFVFSFYAKGAYDGQEMASYFYNPSNTTTTETSQGVKGGAGDGKAVTKLTTAWARYWVKWVIPATSGTKRLIAARLESATSADKEVWLCRPQLETGTVMTDWSPSPDDAASGITANTSAINSLTSRVTNAEGQLTAQSQSITNLQNSLNTTNNNVAQKASAQSVSDLTSRVTSAEGKITSQGQAITKLQGDLSSTTDKVNTKADQTALNALTGRVEKTEAGLTAANSNIVSLTAAVNAGNAAGDDYIPNPSFDPAYDRMGYDVVETTADGVPADCPFRYAVRLAGRDHVPKINNIAVTPGDVYEMSALVACGTGSADFNFCIGRATTATGGIGARASGGNTRTTTAWKRATWRFTVPADTNFLRPFLQVNQSSPFGTVWYAADWHMRNVTAANSAQKTADATAKAVDSLTTTVSQQGDTLSSIGTRTTSLENSLRSTNDTVSKKADTTAVTQLQGTVTQQGNDIAAANSALTKLSGDLAVTNAAVSKKAEQSAVTGLTTRMTSAEGKLDSQSQQLTSLQNSLTTMNTELGKKADTSAVSSLTGRVSQVENTITSQSQSITSLTSTINTIRTQGANPWVDGTFESYSDGQVLGGSGTAVVVASQKFTGDKSLKLRRDENDSGNSDKQLGTWQSVREDAKFRFEFWAMMPADQAPSSGWTTLVGIQSQNAAGQNAWQAAVTISEASLGARDKWVKFTGIASNNGAGRTRAVVWISTRGATGNGTPGYSLYIDDLVITDVTDAKAAQDASDATASAVSGLTARVTDAEGKITAQAQQQTALATKVDNANSRVDNMAKTLSDSQSTQASLNTSLQSQIDAQAAANIKNQTTLDNTIKSVASITSTQQTHATALEALATQQTTLTSSVGDLSASVQNTAKTVADVNGTVSSLWSMKVETVNGKNVGAGITLGSNGETSDMILYADRFSLFNRNNATAVPVMVAEGNELYIDTARIKNSSLTSTKIADGSITNAKIGNEIRSNDFVDGSRGWRIAKDGSSQFNNVIVRGAVYATDGWFQGTVYANHIEGDIGSFAINIAQHRTRKVPKATWQWFELARFRRQNFDQVINIRGGLLQTDSITIDGGAKLRAGMSYAPGADGGLNPGYLSYAMLLRGTGATSGGGSMELGIELMYETGGATRLLTAQESMNVDNMSFVVPAGTGDAVLRYGCYLDRNGQMVLTILSRFDAFAARNNNVIRGSST